MANNNTTVYMQYPFKQGDSSYDGRIHEIVPILLIRIGDNTYNSEYYCLHYRDNSLPNSGIMMTIIRRDRYGRITKIPLENYNGLTEYVGSHITDVIEPSRLLRNGMTIYCDNYMTLDRIDSYIRGISSETQIKQEERAQVQVATASPPTPPLSPPTPPIPPKPPTPPGYLRKEKVDEKEEIIWESSIKFYRYRDRYFIDNENIKKIERHVPIIGEYFFSSDLFFTFDKSETLNKKLYEVSKQLYNNTTTKKTIEIFDKQKKKETTNTKPNKIYVYNDRYYITRDLYIKTMGHPPVYNLGKIFSIYDYDFSEAFGDLGIMLYKIPEHFCSRIPNQEMVYITKRQEKRFR